MFIIEEGCINDENLDNKSQTSKHVNFNNHLMFCHQGLVDLKSGNFTGGSISQMEADFFLESEVPYGGRKFLPLVLEALFPASGVSRYDTIYADKYIPSLPTSQVSAEI